MKLLQCPNSPNCVSSQSDSDTHKTSPLPYQTSAIVALKKIKKVILAIPNTQLKTENDHYLHIEFTSQLFKFIDDVEIVINEEEKVIHLRSASRTGYWDFGTNRRRIEKIKEHFLQ